MTRRLSIIAPCYNEEKYLGRCLDSLLANDFDFSESEILIVDGGSTDRTREILSAYSAKHPFIKLVENPDRIKPIALNRGISAAKGDVIMRVDIHAVYGSNYIGTLVEGLYKEEVDNIGGIRETDIPEGDAWHTAVALAISDPLAVGGAYYRRMDRAEKRFVDTVFGGCYRRDVFDRIGLFNVHLIRTQDKEFNARLLAAGGKILLEPTARCTYFARTEFRRYLKWIYEGAFWVFYAWRFTDTPMLGRRNYIPLLFVLYLAALVAASGLVAIFGGPLGGVMVPILAVPLLAYCVLLFRSGWRASRAHGRNALLFTLPVTIISTHVAYGLGSMVGWIRSRLRGKRKNSNEPLYA